MEVRLSAESWKRGISLFSRLGWDDADLSAGGYQKLDVRVVVVDAEKATVISHAKQIVAGCYWRLIFPARSSNCRVGCVYGPDHGRFGDTNKRTETVIAGGTYSYWN
jgi:hypothetical protein